MATIVIYLKKNLRVFSLFFVLATLMGCIGEEDCNDLGSDVTVPNLVTIIPLETTYQKGDEIILSLSVSSENNYFGNTLDIFQETGDDNPLVSFSSNQLFVENEVDIIQGSQAEFSNQFRLFYNQTSRIYNLEIIITLNRLGQYNIDSIGDRIDFQGSSFCNRYLIETNIQGTNSEFKIEFEVIE